MADLASFKEYAVMDSDVQDSVLQLALDATEEYLKNAGVTEPSEGSALYDLAAYRLAAFYVDHRSFPDVNKDAGFFGVGGIILQLRGEA